jgi:NhaP-type Na+/H+ or K+/H+ antiporter
VASIDAHLLLFTFLPPLIFESAFSIDFNIFARMYKQMLILAGPGTSLLCCLCHETVMKQRPHSSCPFPAFLISVTLTATCAMSVFGDGTDPYASTTNFWTWEVALLYGALMSATDPVAVVRS